MASGHSDWYGLPIFPRYGAATLTSWDENCPAGELTTIKTIIGKGVVYGGYNYLEGGVSHREDVFYFRVDNTTIAAWTHEWMRDKGFFFPDNQITNLILYDDVNFKYGVGIAKFISFEANCIIIYKNETAEDKHAVGSLCYTILP